MARARNRLKAKQAEALTAVGRHADGGGLYLDIDTTRRRWLFLFRQGPRRREMGLGGFPAVSLAEARRARDEAERIVRDGRDPIVDRNTLRTARKAGKPSFGECADAFVAAKESEWRNAKHKAQWRATLSTYCAPIRTRPVDGIDTETVLSVLKPLWSTKAETASRLRGRIEAVLDAARAQGLRTGENPARWRGHLDKLLPKRGKLARGHHAAMPYSDVSAFMARLREQDGTAARALEFCILTATRSGETLGTRWDEIDTKGKVWRIPGARMKAAREHRVPLTDRALAIIEALAEVKVSAFVFPGARADRPLSNMAMEMTLRRMNVDDVTVHGFRSAFRDWAGNETNFPRDLAEAALAHVIGDKAEQAYRRSDALEKRRKLMAAWAAYCEPRGETNVVAMRKSGT